MSCSSAPDVYVKGFEIGFGLELVAIDDYMRGGGGGHVLGQRRVT